MENEFPKISQEKEKFDHKHSCSDHEILGREVLEDNDAKETEHHCDRLSLICDSLFFEQPAMDRSEAGFISDVKQHEMGQKNCPWTESLTSDFQENRFVSWFLTG